MRPKLREKSGLAGAARLAGGTSLRDPAGDIITLRGQRDTKLARFYGCRSNRALQRLRDLDDADLFPG